MTCWIVPVVVDVRSAPRHEVHLTSSRRSHTHSVFGLEWTAGRVVSLPWHNRSCTLLVVLIAVVAISSCLQVCRSKLQIHVRKSRQVTWQFIRSFCCIVSRVASAICATGTSVGCCLLCHQRRNMRTVRLVQQRREGGLASQHSTCFFGLFAIGCLPKCSFQSSDAGPRGAIPDSTALLLLSHSPRQMFCCPFVSDRVKHGAPWMVLMGPLWAFLNQNKNKEVA